VVSDTNIATPGVACVGAVSAVTTRSGPTAIVVCVMLLPSLVSAIVPAPSALANRK
jgi:hypothetical protein